MQISQSRNGPYEGDSETESESTEDDAFLGIVGQGSTDLWATKARVNGIFIKFQIDTGAEVTVLSERDFKRLGGVTLLPSQRTLRGPNQNLLPVKGQFSTWKNSSRKKSH